MNATRTIASYRTTQAVASTPLERVVMLYDGAFRFMDQARAAIERRDIPARRDAIDRALAIISELHSTLDMTRGGAISEELDRLYVFVTDRLMTAAMKNDAAPIAEARRVLDPLRDAWHTIASAPPSGARA